jgi:hypothetical protein
MRVVGHEATRGRSKAFDDFANGMSSIEVIAGLDRPLETTYFGGGRARWRAPA